MKRKLAETVILTASYYGKALNEGLLAMYLEDLEDLDMAKVIEAYKTYRRNPKHTQFPLPAQIRAIVEPANQINDRDLANDLARRLDVAVGKKGAYWAEGFCDTEGRRYWIGGGQNWDTFKDAVIAELGEAGWAIVCQRGGWERLRESANSMSEGQFIAQARDHAETAIKMLKAGMDSRSLALPSPNDRSELSSARDILTLIEAKRAE